METQILATLNLTPQILDASLRKAQPNLNSILSRFIPPPLCFMKLNFDGASKGNPGQAGIGGIFRDSFSKFCHLSSYPMGYVTNNEAELMALKQGLIIAIREGYQRLVVEEDSAMAVGILKKLQQGNPWQKISKSWRIAKLVEDIGNLLRQVGLVICTHVRWEGNEAADYLANWACQNLTRNLDIDDSHKAWVVELYPLQCILDID